MASGHAYARYVPISWDKSRPQYGFPLVSSRQPASSLVLFKCFFFSLLACWVGLWRGRGAKAARGLGLRGSGYRWWGLEEGSLLQGVGISIPQSWGDRFDLCCSCYLCNGGEHFILVSANQKVLETVRDIPYPWLGPLTAHVPESWKYLPLKCELSPSWLCSGKKSN